MKTVPVALSIVVFLSCQALQGQEWVTRTVPGPRTPAEIAAATPDRGGHFGLFFATIFTISRDDSGGDVLEYTRWQVDEMSAAVTNRIPTTTTKVSGMSHQVVSDDGADYVAYVDGGRVMAQRSTDGGETWTPYTVAGTNSYSDVQLTVTTLGPLLAAYNYRLRQIEIYRFIAATLIWNNVGSLLRGKVVGMIDQAPRMTLDGDERKDDIVLGWSELYPGGCTYWVGRFSLPALTPIGSPIRIPVVYSNAGIKDLRMTRAGDYVAGLTAVGDRYKLFSFPYKQSQPAVSVEDLGPVRFSTFHLVGGIGLVEGGTKSVYTATATPAGDVDVRQYLWGNNGIEKRTLPPVLGAHTDPAVNVLPYNLRIDGRGAEMRMRLYYPGSLRVAEFTGCVDSRRRLCSNAHRFDVSVRWRDPEGNSGSGQAVPLTSDTGYFWFFESTNIEMVIKVLNACSYNQRHWVFAGGLTDVEVDITVRDTQTGVVKSYHNPLGTPFQPILDTFAFDGCTAGNDLTTVSSQSEGRRQLQSSCAASETALCVNGGRFRVEANWRTNEGAGSGKAVKLTDDSGYFWFFGASNVELVTKVLNACVDPFNRHWVFAAGLTDVEVELVVTDTVTGQVKRYQNPRGAAYKPVQDTDAFATCP